MSLNPASDVESTAHGRVDEGRVAVQKHQVKHRAVHPHSLELRPPEPRHLISILFCFGELFFFGLGVVQKHQVEHRAVHSNSLERRATEPRNLYIWRAGESEGGGWGGGERESDFRASCRRFSKGGVTLRGTGFEGWS